MLTLTHTYANLAAFCPSCKLGFLISPLLLQMYGNSCIYLKNNRELNKINLISSKMKHPTAHPLAPGEGKGKNQRAAMPVTLLTAGPTGTPDSHHWA